MIPNCCHHLELVYVREWVALISVKQYIVYKLENTEAFMCRGIKKMWTALLHFALHSIKWRHRTFNLKTCLNNTDYQNSITMSSHRIPLSKFICFFLSFSTGVSKFAFPLVLLPKCEDGVCQNNSSDQVDCGGRALWRGGYFMACLKSSPSTHHSTFSLLCF